MGYFGRFILGYGISYSLTKPHLQSRYPVHNLAINKTEDVLSSVFRFRSFETNRVLYLKAKQTVVLQRKKLMLFSLYSHMVNQANYLSLPAHGFKWSNYTFNLTANRLTRYFM